MKYWHARGYIPFCGEEADVYIQAETQEKAMLKAREAARENSIQFTNICKVCRRERKTAGGFVWKYKND